MKSRSGERPPWKRVEAVLDQLLDEFPDAGSSGGVRVSGRRLDELCGSDVDLRREVELLLAASGERDDLLDHSLADALPDVLAELDRDSEADEEESRVAQDGRVLGRTLDRYRLLEVLGRGGMGVVYLAERADAQFDKRVALKIMPRGLESADKERRFRTERQILARLEHDNIARLLDGGVTEDGYPYLVMERIEGEPIDLYCEHRALPLRQRLRLFLDVCAAVQYAHENLVLHRDLKPGNILVTGDRRVKLLDFGVGKILDDSDEVGETRLQPMTPEYASPEQRQNRPASTASDVYSLGLVLRRLITGQKPSGSDAAPRLDADLRVIVDKALRESPNARFRSVAALAADLERYLDGRPIESRAATLRYRLSKFVSRHRLATVNALVVALLLIAAMITVLWQARVARDERDRARVEASKARTVADLLGGLFAATDPNSPGAGQLSAGDLLEQGESKIRQELADQPEVLSELLTIIGYAHSSLGNDERGAALIEEAIREMRAIEPLDELALAGALERLASVYRDSGALELASARAEEALELLRKSGALESLEGARLLRELGRIDLVAHRHEEAERSLESALETFERLGATDEVALTKIDLAIILDRTARTREALGLKREALATLVSVYGEGHPMVSDTRNNIGVTLHAMGELEEAESALRQALRAAEQTYGPDHPAVANSLSNLGKVLMDRGHFEDAAPFVRRAAELRRTSSAPDAYGRLGAEMNLAGLDLALGDVEEAIALYREGLARFEQLTGSESGASARVRSLLGIALHRAGELATARELLAGALELQGREAPPVHRAETVIGLGSVLADIGRAGEAEPLLRQGLELWLEVVRSGHWRVAEARIELAGALLRKNGPTPAERAEAERLLSDSQGAVLEEAGFRWLRERAAAFRQLVGAPGRA